MKHLFFAAALLASPLIAVSGAHAETALYLSIPSVSGATLSEWDAEVSPIFSDAECVVHRSGNIADAKGPLDWPAHETFRLYKCGTSVLDALVASGVTEKLSTFLRKPVLIEGDLMTIDPAAPKSDAEYIIKIDYNNSLDGTERNKALQELGAATSGLEGIWHTEGVLIPTKSVGAIRPDDVTFIFFDTHEMAENFRKNNPEILEMVGQFNTAHLSSFLYIGATITEN